MNLCKDCMFYKNKEEDDYGYCMSDHVYDGVLWSPDFRRDDFGTSYDDSTIIVGPDFGCVHWRVK